MQWVAQGFLFVRGNTYIHKMDPRVRLLTSLILFSLALISHSIEELAVIVLLVFAAVSIARIVKRFGKAMMFTAVIALVAFGLNLFFTPSSPHQAVVFGMRLFAVISSTSLFFLTATPDELEHVMKWLHLPSDFVMVFVIAVRFIPVLLLDALQIMDAQRSRGLEFDKGNILRRIRNVIPVMVPLIAVALNRSLDLAEAMDSRAYGSTKRPTSLYHLKLSKPDFAMLVVLAAGAMAGIYVTYSVTLF
ncbi:MAG: energy-coupling factor transporter transmembrane protein EcfT [Nitrososphaerota archaeon]|nr:energy-coupling factor transporter transmembrane protein EcfT [Nitrososphaerota archaeon]